MKHKILVVAAHPDDEVLGCGGAMARLARDGVHEVFTLILGEGITSRDGRQEPGKSRRDLARLRRAAKEANRLLGVQEVFLRDLPDNSFDSVPLLSVVKIVEEIKKRLRPKIVFTHYGKDLNVDHRVAFEAVITATRPMPGETVREVYSFEVPSSTEWAYPLSFSPDTFIDISGTLDRKLRALREYKGEMRPYPHPRSLKGVRLNAEHRGLGVGLGCAEAFQCVRRIWR